MDSQDRFQRLIEEIKQEIVSEIEKYLEEHPQHSITREDLKIIYLIAKRVCEKHLEHKTYDKYKIDIVIDPKGSSYEVNFNIKPFDSDLPIQIQDLIGSWCHAPNFGLFWPGYFYFSGLLHRYAE